MNEKTRNTAIFVGVSLAVMAGLIGTVLLLREDSAFIQVECEGKQVDLHWQANVFPLRVYTDEANVALVTEAAEFWNSKLKAEAFNVRKLDALAKLDPAVVVSFDPDLKHGKSRLKWLPNCELSRVEVSVPSSADVDLEVVLHHELGHSLGLAHDNIERTVMHPKYHWVGTRVSDADVGRVRISMGAP